MTTYVNPSNNFRPLSEEMGRVFVYAAHHDGFIADGTTLVADIDSVGLTAGPLNAYVKVSESGLDVTIDTGEAVIDGAMVAKDTQTTVTLPASSSPTVVLAWDPGTENSVLIDTQANVGSSLPQIPLYDFVTDASSVTSETDRRPLGEHIAVQNQRYETSDGSGMPVDQADDASTLNGQGVSDFGILSQDELVSGSWTFDDTVNVDGPNGAPAIHVVGANAVDADTVIIDGDADSGQDDDLIKVRGVANPETDTATDSDTVFVTKGDGRVGINTFTPSRALQVIGDVEIGETFFRGPTHFQRFEALGFVLDNRTDDPGSPAVGEMWYRTDQD